MAKFKITDNQTGKSVVVNGDGAPSEQEAEQIFADAGLREAAPMPAAPQPAAPAPSSLVDAIRAVPGGLAQGVAGALGAPRDLNDLAQAGIKWAGNKLSPGAGDKVIDTFNSMPGPGTALTGLQLPGSGTINKAVSEPFGGYYKPQTMTGEYAQTISSFAPNALLPGGLPARAARVLVPGAASETAGQLTKGTKYEPFARAAGALAGGLGVGAVEGVLSKTKVPTLEELGQMKDAAYKAADQAGVVIAPQSFQKFASDLGADITKNNVVQADIHPNTLNALKVLQEEAASGAPMSLARADAVRKAVNGAISSAVKTGNGDDVRIAAKVKEGLDNYLEALTPADTLAGDASVAVPVLKQARDLARREFKAEKMQELIDLAENAAGSNYSASGFEQALRAQFKNFNAQLIKNKNLAKSFTDEERKAIVRVVQGAPVENALRYFGKLAPTNVISGGIGSAMGAGVGGALGGPVGAGVGAVTMPAVGAISRSGAAALTTRNANNAATLMRAGQGSVPGVLNVSPGSLLLSGLLSQQPSR